MKHLILDLDGVLYKAKPQPEFFNQKAISLLLKKYGKSLDLGEISLQTFLAEYAQSGGQKMDVQNYLTRYYKDAFFNDALKEFCIHYKATFSTTIFSNSVKESYLYLDKIFKFKTWTYKQLLSFDAKKTKPDLAFFKQLLVLLDAKPEDCLYVDDTMRNIEAARKLGMAVLLYSDHKNTMQALRHYAEH